MKIFKDDKIYIIDGAMGTQIMQAGVEIGVCFEGLNLKRPEVIQSIHKAYVNAGADIIETNTFGGTKIKLKSYGLENKFEEINYAGVKIAKKAAGNRALVAASMGPCGELMEPIGRFTFDEAYREFSAQAKIFEKAGADLISIETMSDIAEVRAAVIAVKENTSLPVIVHLTYAGNKKTITGTPVAVAVAVLEALGVDAIGANCSTGPKDMYNVAKELIKYANVPVSIMSNAGNPEIIDDETVYNMPPKEFAKYAKKFAEIGVKFIGGCCGTGPEHIEAIKSKIQASPPPAMLRIAKRAGLTPLLKERGTEKEKRAKQATIMASRTQVLEIDNKKTQKQITIIGERINPTNRLDLQQELKEGKTNIIRQNAVSQIAAGADMLDVNIGFPEIDEVVAMKKAVLTVESSCEAPLCLDSSNPLVLEEGLKNYAGKALINSVNAKEESLKAILPLAKKYGAAIIGLTIDKTGIKSKAADRFLIAKKIVDRAAREGISKKDIFIDVLTLSAGAQQADVIETLKAIKFVKTKLGVKTSLGVSNVSHGLPNRRLLNAAFLKLSKKYGLDAAIYNPENLKTKITKEQYSDAVNVFLNKDKGAKTWIKKNSAKPAANVEKSNVKEKSLSIAGQIRICVIEGNKEKILSLIENAIKTIRPQTIIDGSLLPGIEEVGRRFSSGQYFIPQVMASAEVMKTAFERVKKEIKPGEQKKIGTAVIATVLGDIHDIGKNIVSMLMENHGFHVIDLGRDVPSEKIVSAAKENKADMIMLSALLTTTMPQMKVVKKLIDDEGLKMPVMVGGAPVTNNFAVSMNANFAKDAISAVEVAKKIIAGSH